MRDIMALLGHYVFIFLHKDLTYNKEKCMLINCSDRNNAEKINIYEISFLLIN